MAATVPSYLVRVRPKEGQSLSSWRQDAAIANGYDIYPVPRGALRRVDPDAGANPAELDWLARTHRVELEMIESLTLQAFEGTVFRLARVRCHPPWLLRTRYSRGWQVPGPQYCPRCLAEPEGAYFRTSWRLGFATLCPVHLCEMLDRCPACGAGVWPVGATVRQLFEVDEPPDYRCCIRCGFPLSAAPTKQLVASQEAARWATSLIAGSPQELSTHLSVASVDYLQALDAICHLFIRKSARKQILLGPAVWAEAARCLALGRFTNQVEFLGVEDRRTLIDVARPLLRDWPQAFVEFARQTALSRVHFSGAERGMPDWMMSAIHQNLRKQIRVSVAAVSAEIEAMQSAGLKVTKQALRTRLRSDATAINVFFPCRVKALREEKARFARQLAGRRQRKRKRRQTLALVRNQLHVMLSVVAGKPLDAITLMTTRQIQEVVDGTSESGDLPDRTLVHALREDWYRLVAKREGWGDPSFPFRTSRNTDPARFARRALVKAMVSIDPDLRRDVCVFWRNAAPRTEA